MPVHENEWLITQAVVRGKSHIDSNTPCQDACEVQTSDDGRWIAAVVSDGAGTALRAQEGSRLVAHDVAHALIAETPRIDQQGPGGWLKDRIQGILINVRQKLRDAGRESRLCIPSAHTGTHARSPARADANDDRAGAHRRRETLVSIATGHGRICRGISDRHRGRRIFGV